MLGTTLDYLAQIGPPAITVMGHGFLSFTVKDYNQMMKRQVMHGYHSWPGKI